MNPFLLITFARSLSLSTIDLSLPCTTAVKKAFRNLRKWQWSRRTLGSPHLMNTARQLPNYSKYPRNNLKTDRINTTTTGREEATSKKVGTAERWFGGEMDHGCCKGEGAVGEEKGKRERSTKGSAQEHFRKALAGKKREADF